MVQKITSKDFAVGLLYLSQKFSNHFYEDFFSHAQKIIGIALDNIQLITLRREINTIVLWIISKILSTDKKVLNELHKIYLSPHAECNFLPHINENICYGSFLPHINQEEIGQWIKQNETGKLQEIFKRDKQELDERYKEYYKDWNDKGSEQFILTMSMLQHMFNKQRLWLNAKLGLFVGIQVYTMMKSIIETRGEYEIID